MQAWRIRAMGAGVVVAAYVVAAMLLPRGLPIEALIPGLIVGALSSLTALGLVLIYRATRIINFAQANMGAIVATLVVLLVESRGWNYWLAIVVGVVAAIAIGAWVEKAFISWFAKAPRLIVTVVTIGIAQLLAGATILMQRWFGGTDEVATVTRFRSPLGGTLDVGSLVLTGDHFLAIAAVPLVLVGLVWFFNRTDAGMGIRAAADSPERARLLGIPVEQLSRLTWVIASVMSALGAVLLAGVNGFQSNVLPGPESLMLPLAAAVVARFESLAVAFAASLVIGVTQQAIFWSYPRSSVVDLVMFVVILIALLARRQASTRVAGEDLGGFVALSEPRPLPPALLHLPEIRAIRAGALALALLVVVGLPLTFNNSQLTFFSFLAIFVIVAASLVLLAGWGGQVSLGQFAFVGLGAGVTGWLLTTYQASLLVCLVASASTGLAVAVLIGLPALRLRGLHLAAVTLAFAVPASTFFLSSQHVPSLTPLRVDPPVLFGRFDLSSARPFYYLCLVFALVALGLARNFRASRIGRAAVGVRDNERMAAALSISATRTKLVTFGMSGALAGLAGGLYVLAYRGVPFNGFAPVLSLQAFTMVVVGGMASLWGGVLGAVYVYVAQYYLGSWAQLVVTGGGIIAILQFAPGGLAQLSYQLRDLALGPILRRRGLNPNVLFGRTDDVVSSRVSVKERLAARAGRRRRKSPPTVGTARGLIDCQEIEGGYGHLQILFGVDFHVGAGEIFGLLGTNGAGKSTILKVIAGVLDSDRGRVFFDDEDITWMSPADRVRRGVVLVPGGRGVFGSLTVRENLRLAGWIVRQEGDGAFVDAMTDRVFELFPILRERLDQRASLLSGGEQQMLTIAQALLCRPRLLMIDELSLGLAPVVVGMLLEVVRSLNDAGITIILVEQSMNIATSIAPRAVFLEKGQVRFTGATTELAADSELVRAVFLGTKGSPTAGRLAQRRPPTPDRPRVAALEATGIQKWYGGVRAVDCADLTVYEGQVLGVIGANGAGKTTLFDIISGMVRPDAGRVMLHGRDVTTTSAADRAALGMGRTFQDLRLIPSMTVPEVLALAHERHVEVREPAASVFAVGAALRSEAGVRNSVDELMATFNLERFRNTFVNELSTGTRRVVELACAYAHEPSVLVLDEPSSGLAQAEAEAMTALILDIKERTGAAIAIIEHDMPVVLALADEVACMHLGSVLARGAPDAVLTDDEVVAAYLGFDDVAVRRSGPAIPVT
ncbi:MAG: hypothetical protein QOG87_832 [Actinomycetota bacterium]